jgi:pimeloyl-ACP methyl ester carboxylesterase
MRCRRSGDGPILKMQRREKSRKSSARAAAARRIESADWAFRADDEAVLQALARGRHKASLREYFGSPVHAELSVLAQSAERGGRRGGARVLILPGIMGSKLGRESRPTHARPSSRGTLHGLLWMDPLRISDGRLTALALPAGSRLRAMGVLLISYARLKLELEIAGNDVALHAYDWRRGIDELGRELATRIVGEGRPVVLVAHSMGGLVARVAAGLLPKRWIRRLILLGTPNHGSFASVQALRGTYPTVRKIASLDRRHSAHYLAERVFGTFPGLYHLLPSKQSRGLDLLDPRSWPAGRPRPDPEMLARVRAARAMLAPPDARMTHIVGVNQDTVVGLRRKGAGFEYLVRKSGDGTVPLAFAALRGLDCYYVEELHSNLAGNARVVRAVVDLVRRGRTRLLPTRWRGKPGPIQRIDDAALRRERTVKIDWRRLSPAERQAALADLDSARLVCRV